MKGVVPFFEEFDAMVEANFNAVEWRGLRNTDRAEAVARYRLKKQIIMHEADALDEHMKTKKRK